MKWLAAAAVVFFILLITCPGEERHRQTVVDEIVEAAQREVPWQSGDDTPLGSFSGTIGNLIVSRFADAVVGQFMSVDNYVIFSVGTIRYGGETKTISFGILGHVFTFDADDIGKAVDKEQPAPDASFPHENQAPQVPQDLIGSSLKEERQTPYPAPDAALGAHTGIRIFFEIIGGVFVFCPYAKRRNACKTTPKRPASA